MSKMEKNNIDLSDLVGKLYEKDITNELESFIEKDLEIAAGFAIFGQQVPLIHLEQHSRPYIEYRREGIIHRRLRPYLILPYLERNFKLTGLDYTINSANNREEVVTTEDIEQLQIMRSVADIGGTDGATTLLVNEPLHSARDVERLFPEFTSNNVEVTLIVDMKEKKDSFSPQTTAIPLPMNATRVSAVINTRIEYRV